MESVPAFHFPCRCRSIGPLLSCSSEISGFWKPAKKEIHRLGPTKRCPVAESDMDHIFSPPLSSFVHVLLPNGHVFVAEDGS